VEDWDSLKSRIRELEQRLAECDETLLGLRNGEVDAGLSTGGPNGHRVYKLNGADEPYRRLVQQMAEGALTLTGDGFILFANQQFANTVGLPLERVTGSRLYDFVDPNCREMARALIERASVAESKGEVRLRRVDGRTFPAYIGVNRLQMGSLDGFCAVVTDLTEPKRNEEIVNSEKLARSILEQAAEAILVVDVEGRIIRASRAAERMAGKNVLLRELDDVFQICSGAGAPLDFGTMLAMARRGAGPEPLEMISRQADGNQLWVLVSVAPLSGADGELLGCIVHITDVTHRKEIERTLRESEAMYRSLADAMPQIVYVNRPDGTCEFVNRKFDELTGESTTAKTVGVAWIQRLHPDDREAAVRRWAQCLESGEPFQMEHRFLAHDGEYHWQLSRAIPILDEGGSIMKWIGTATDIDEFKHTESKLRESEERLRTMADMVPAILFTALPDGQSDYTSSRAYEYTGAAAGALDGSGWLVATHPEDREMMARGWKQAVASGTTFAAEFRMRTVSTGGCR
jgi:PAS domain S-box-containing protein